MAYSPLSLSAELETSDNARRLLEALDARRAARGVGEPILTSGLQRGFLPFMIHMLARRGDYLQVILCRERASAEYLYADLSPLFPPEKLYYFPSTYHGSHGGSTNRNESIVHRNELIGIQHQLVTPWARGVVIVTTLPGWGEGFVSDTAFHGRTLSFERGAQCSIEEIEAALVELGFEPTEFVFHSGQYARRGSIVDLFSYADTQPYRFDFLGDTIDSLRTFDVETQLSTGQVQRVQIVPNFTQEESSKFLPDFLTPESTLLWAEDMESALSNYATVLTQGEETSPLSAVKESKSCRLGDSQCLTASATREAISRFITISYGEELTLTDANDAPSTPSLHFTLQPQPLFDRNIPRFIDYLNTQYQSGGRLVLAAGQESQRRRLRELLHEANVPEDAYALLDLSITKGFVDPTLKLSVFTDHELFNRYHVAHFRRQMPRRDAQSVMELGSISPGDYVVHVDHGVGIYEGLVIQQKEGVTQEFVRLRYRDKDTLLVSIHNLHRLAKYHGQDGESPQLHRLGSGAWGKLKDKAKGRIQEMARELIALYAERRAKKGFAFSKDTYLQESLEASFLYEDTPDQLSATLDVKRDMESPIPMDRLICGDVGFGKTEVAIRAAFKAVADGKQVAVLVPTTVLSLQHYNTFSSRLADFPCRVDFLSRLKGTAERKTVLKELSDGKIDIIIGTHALLGKGVTFRNLGLLIIDEEQKFGVKAKEHLKMLRKEVDTLTLSATPIPRTLQFSLMGARDFSIIRTPPPNRYPIVTEVCLFDRGKIAEVIRAEMQRGGQVFFVHNWVQNLQTIESVLHELVPEARIGVGHGQMPAAQLEGVMMEFIAGDYDVLLSTSIIESGIDIPNANTIIINNGHCFGLSDLHQLRGRVGRTNRKAYCYIMVPVTETLSSTASRRLKAIVDFSDLGSGLSISMQDLDIRGAGNLLGAEQSGFIVDLGYETYQRILDEALQELKTSEFAELYESTQEASAHSARYSSDCIIETDLDILIPDEYVANPSERIRLYRELDLLDSPASLKQFAENLKDRYGAYPERVAGLLAIPPLRWLAMELGIEKVTLKNQRLKLYFVGEQNRAFYASETFQNLLARIPTIGSKATLKQSEQGLQLEVGHVGGVEHAHRLLSALRVE